MFSKSKSRLFILHMYKQTQAKSLDQFLSEYSCFHIILLNNNKITKMINTIDKVNIIETQMFLSIFKIQLGACGAHLYSLHLGGRGRQISVSSRTAWSTKQVPGHPGLLHRETLS